MRFASVAIAFTLPVIVTGCSGDDGSQATADCSARVRADDIVYTSYGFTERNATKHSVAEQADCDDVGKDAAGSVFSGKDSKQVTTWSFPGYPPEEVVGVRFDKDSLAVFVADSVPNAERERIFKELGQPPP